MSELIAFLKSYGVIIALVLALVGLPYRIIPVHTAARERRRKEAKESPGVQATINKMPSVDGWRSIQLHITAPEATADNLDFQASGWRIMSAKLVAPRNATVAFAREDDHSLRGPIDGLAERVMSGRMGDVQPYALEFFIRFPGTPTSDHGMRARFRVKLWRKKEPDRVRSLDVWAEVPLNADSEAPTS
jgi:hypothetical protein